ncbi:hypothetical protein RJ641_004769 [Dillenia turbinata]|uniref:Uncharacterized protein n=1 Tax=Dillenia turbinata TaxID=194707 RepID=A0AAN8ZDA0_9MAGN
MAKQGMDVMLPRCKDTGLKGVIAVAADTLYSATGTVHPDGCYWPMWFAIQLYYCHNTGSGPHKVSLKSQSGLFHLKNEPGQSTCKRPIAASSVLFPIRFVLMLEMEKHREKKHKKEKDKEKKESKVKRDKDRNEGKHRDKKDKKEKHRDKKKDREDKEKDKDRASISDERLAGHPENNTAKKFGHKEKEKEKDGKNSAVEKRPVVHPEVAEESKDLRFVQDLGRRIRDEAKGAGSQLLEKPGTDPRRDVGVVVFKRNDIGNHADSKDTTNNERNGNENMDRKTYRDKTRLGGNSMLQNLARLAQNRVEGPPRQMENIPRKIEEKEKSKEKREDKRSNKRKEKDREKKSHGKDKERDKGKKEEKMKEKSKAKNIEQEKAKERNKIDTMVNHIKNTTILPKDGDTSAAIEGDSRKRKVFEVNGFLHESEVAPNKLQKPTSSGQPTENGRKFGPCQSAILSISEKQGVPNNFKGAPTPNNFKVENKGHKLNGIIEAQPMPIYPPKQMSATTQADPIEEASKRPPHCDFKYLSQILAVPKMEEWSELDNQEWLLGSDSAAPKEPLVGSSLSDETPQVWAEALKIESADVYALPYVLPY